MKTRISPWLGFHLLILLYIVLVLVALRTLAVLLTRVPKRPTECRPEHVLRAQPYVGIDITARRDVLVETTGVEPVVPFGRRIYSPLGLPIFLHLHILTILKRTPYLRSVQ